MRTLSFVLKTMYTTFVLTWAGWSPPHASRLLGAWGKLAFRALLGVTGRFRLAVDLVFALPPGPLLPGFSGLRCIQGHLLEERSEILYRRKDGTECWATIFISPVQDGAVAVVEHFVSLVDVTKHKQAHAQAKTLIDELNHRVKNTLSTMQSIVWQAFKNASDKEAIRESIEARLFALSRSHDLLTREHWESAGLF